MSSATLTRLFFNFCSVGIILKDLGGNYTFNTSEKSGGFMDFCVNSNLSLKRDMKKREEIAEQK